MIKVKEKHIAKWLRVTMSILITLGVFCAAAVGVLNAWVKLSTEDQILTQQQAAQLQDVDCIVVLGCGVNSNGEPSAMLTDRLTRGIALYKDGAALKLLMSGDHGRETYDEVNTMKRVAVKAGVPSEDVFMDHAGFSTYETMYRAKEIFGAEKVLVVTQRYHLYRALYIAEALGIEAYGVDADYRSYGGQTYRDIREILARVKDFFTAIIQPMPTYTGDPIPISGNGELTHDKNSNFD